MQAYRRILTEDEDDNDKDSSVKNVDFSILDIPGYIPQIRKNKFTGTRILSCFL